MNYIISNNKSFFEKIGDYNYCSLEDMILPNAIAIDTETTDLVVRRVAEEFLGAELFATQIGTGDNNYLIDLQEHNNGLSFEQLIPYIQDKILVLHNATFDLRLFYKHGFFPSKIHDTFIASKMYYNGARNNVFTHDFGSVMERELGITYDKSEQKNIHKIQLRTTKSIEYCFNDVDRLLDLGRHMYKKLNEEGFTKSYVTNCQFTRALAYMEMCGLPLNEEKWSQKIQDDIQRLDELKEEITEYICKHLPSFKATQYDMFDTSNKTTLNFDSPKQMIPVFKSLGINIINPEGKESIKEDVINKTEHEFVDLWLDYQGVRQNISTFGQNVLDKAEGGRIFTSFNPMVDTCRISSKKGGINFLNFPADEKTRDCFEAQQGHKMIVCDYEGQENVVGADLHHDPVMVASINENLDLHCAFARVLFPELKDLSDDEIKKNHKSQRSFSKSPRFLFSYGGSYMTLNQQLNIEIDRAKVIESAYKELHWGVYEWGKNKLEESTKKGYIESGGGFKLFLPFFETYLELDAWIKTLDKSYWVQYRKGKKENQQKWDDEYYVIQDYDAYDLYMRDKKGISDYFKRKSEYQKLCLNNPIQTISAHQTKSALIRLFDYILEHNHMWRVKICNSPYDEIVLEVQDDLCEEYKHELETCMIEEGDKWLTSGKVFMRAEANIGESWDKAK